MSNGKILIVEDDVGLARILTGYLNKNGYQADTVPSAAQMFKKFDTETFDCIIMDLGLPDEDGIVLVRKLRARSEFLPIIVLTGREGLDPKVASCELGADDYINKPVDPRELVLRINAVMRRAVGPEVKAKDILHLNAIVLDHARHEAYNKDGELIGLTPAEFSLIWVLANAGDKVLSRNILVDAISSGEGPISMRAVDILISRLRKKLDKSAIETVPKAGYKCGWSVSKV